MRRDAVRLPHVEPVRFVGEPPDQVGRQRSRPVPVEVAALTVPLDLAIGENVDSRRLEVNLKHVYTGEAALTAELERRLGGHVVYQEIEAIDLVHNHLTVDVRLRPGPVVATQPVDTVPSTAETDAAPEALSVDAASVDGHRVSGRRSAGLDQTD